MTPLQYYLFANIYILVFWLLYRICLRNPGSFNAIRQYLNSAVLLSVFLPLIQYGIAKLLGPGSSMTVLIGENIPVIDYVYLSGVFVPESVSSLNWQIIMVILLMAGSAATTLRYLYNHFRILNIIRRSSECLQSESRLNVMLSDEVITPFIYNKVIVLPGTIPSDELSVVIDHETMHYQFGHHLDNKLYSFLNLVFWFNPFFLLLQRALKLNHEYQVDGKILTSGVDPITYKLSLIRNSVGTHKFSLATGLASSNLKKRLLMMNTTYIRKGNWRLYAMIPIVGLLFMVFCYACVQTDHQEIPGETIITKNQQDSVVVEFIDVRNDNTQDWNKRNVIMVLMNRSSEIMIANEKLPLHNAEQKIISVYNQIIEESNTMNADNIKDNKPLDIRIVVHKDITANLDEYNNLLDAISTALLKLRNIHSNNMYGKRFDSLTNSEKEGITDLIPLRIYGLFPDKKMGLHYKSE